jgi:hypothetical protein
MGDGIALAAVKGVAPVSRPGREPIEPDGRDDAIRDVSISAVNEFKLGNLAKALAIVDRGLAPAVLPRQAPRGEDNVLPAEVAAIQRRKGGEGSHGYHRSAPLDFMVLRLAVLGQMPGNLNQLNIITTKSFVNTGKFAKRPPRARLGIIGLIMSHEARLGILDWCLGPSP